MKTVRDWFDGLEDPKMVGASEYADIYDNLDGVLVPENYDDDEANGVAFAHAVLDEFIAYAVDLKRSLTAFDQRVG